MAWIEMYVSAPEHLNNPDSIAELDDEITKTTLVCFYRSVVDHMPAQQMDKTWGLRLVDRKQLKWLKTVLSQHNFTIVDEILNK